MFEVKIPLVPPGINATYKIGKSGTKGHLYKDKAALNWQSYAALIIGAKAGECGFKVENCNYAIEIEFGPSKLDIDAPIKLIIDTVSRKLGFDDRKITKLCCLKNKEVQGVLIKLYKKE